MKNNSWRNEYFNERKINILKYFDSYYISILTKLGIILDDKLYTEYEFELLEMELSKFHDNEQEHQKLGVSCDEIQEINEIFNNIEKEYNI